MSTLRLTRFAIYDEKQELIWGYGECSDDAWDDARQEYTNNGFSGDPADEPECKLARCSETLAAKGLGGKFDFVVVAVKTDDELRTILGVVTPSEAEEFTEFEC